MNMQLSEEIAAIKRDRQPQGPTTTTAGTTGPNASYEASQTQTLALSIAPGVRWSQGVNRQVLPKASGDEAKTQSPPVGSQWKASKGEGVFSRYDDYVRMT